MRESGPEGSVQGVVLAPLWRRSAAAIIDVTGIFGGVVGGLGLLAALMVVPAEHSARFEKQLERWAAPPRKPLEKQAAAGNRLRWASAGVWLPMAITRRNHQTYGQLLMRVRRVDAKDGGPVSVTSAVVRFLGVQFITAATPRQTPQEKAQMRERRKATFVPELAKLMKSHAGDRSGLLREALRLEWKQRPNMFIRIALETGVPLAAHLVFVLALPKHQSLPDFAAGIVTTTTK